MGLNFNIMPSGTQDKKFAELMRDQVDEVKISHAALDEAITWIADNLEPDDVFPNNQLERLAESNGFVKE